MAMHTKLYAYKQYVSDKKSFGYDDLGARIGETPNMLMDMDNEESAAFIVKAVNCHEELLADNEFLKANVRDISRNYQKIMIANKQLTKALSDILENCSLQVKDHIFYGDKKVNVNDFRSNAKAALTIAEANHEK